MLLRGQSRRLRHVGSADSIKTATLVIESCVISRALDKKRVFAELAARTENEKVELGPDLRTKAPAPEPSATALQSKSITYVLLLRQVLERRNQSGESKMAVLESWVSEHRELSRTQVTDYLAGRIKGRVSAKKCEKIEAAILASTEKLKSATRT